MTHDLATGRDAYAGAGTDTRGWVHHAIVEPDAGDQHSVVFSGDDGSGANPFGVQVLVKLAPNGNVLPCRVAGACAGAGEGEYHPFVAGDEVLVVVPSGDERNGGIIIGRLNQTLDVFPRMVAGQDVTNNSVAFKRLAAPYVLESGTALILRVSATGAALTLDPTGNTYLSSGGGAALYLRSDAVSLQLKDGTAAFQLDPDAQSAKVVAGDGNTVVSIDGSADSWQTQGTLSISTAGNAGVNHVITMEAVLAVFNAFLQLASKAATAPPALVAFFAAFSAPGALGAVFAAAAKLPVDPVDVQLALAALQLPKSGGAPGVGSQGTMVD